MGDSLQELLASDDAGKLLKCIHPGDDETGAKWKQQVIRIYFQNVNGLKLHNGGVDILETFLQLQNAQVDIFGLAETNLNCQDPYIQSVLQQQKRKVWEHCKLFTCSSDEEWPTNHKPGGTLLGVTGPLVGRTKTHSTDKYGRWTRLDMLGRNGRTLTVLCAYQVVQEKGNHGDSTVYSQQVRLMRLDGVHDPDPRKLFIQDLTVIVRELRKSDNDVILMGDFNELIGAKPEGMASVMTAGQLTDTFCYRHHMDQEMPTYARGTKRVDYILVSSRLLEYTRRCGAEPFNYRIFSDHRGLFVDFSLPGFFDRSPNAMASMATRDLIYDCPRHVKKYLAKTAEYFRDHDIMFRLQELQESPRDDDAAEALDRDITRGMLAAEATCKSTARLPWSTALHTVMNKLYVLKRALSQALTGLDMSSSIATMQAKLEEPVDIPSDEPEIKAALREVRREQRKVVQQGHQLRQEQHKVKILARQLASPKRPPEKVEQEYYNIQASKEMYKKVPSSKPRTTGGITMIKVPENPDDDPKDKKTKFKAIVDMIEVEEQIIERNRRHFSQASVTPLAQPIVTDLLGFGGTEPYAELLLQGIADPSVATSDALGQEILQQCRRVHPEGAAEISLEEFQKGYKTWNVRTSTSPSGRHLGHQHVLFQAHGIDKTTSPDEFREAEKSRDDNWKAQHGILSYGIAHGYCFNRWTKVVNAMIEKEPGNPQLHRLRVIHLYESDYNSMLGIKMRQVVHKCEDTGSLNPGAYGSRANRQALDPVYLEVLQGEYASLTRWSEIQFSNDATSCYDRIIPSVSNVIARAMGLHKHIAQIHGSMLAHAEYRIKTQLGISNGIYEHSLSSPVFGTGQGSCASPPIWMLNCSKYFTIYDQQCRGARYYGMEGDWRVKLGMVGFVDDNRSNVNAGPSEDEDTLIANATHDAQLWSDILWSSGGALEHPKCSYHYLKTDFTPYGAPVFRPGQFGTPIPIKDSSGNTTILEQLSAYQAYKTLGTYQAATRSQTLQFEMLQKKASQLCRTLALSSCSPNAAWLFFSSMFMKGIGYPLPVSRMSKKQLHALQGPMLSLSLNRMGYPKRLARLLVHGPRFFGGLEMDQLENLQGSSKLSIFIRHLRTAGQPKELSLTVLDRLQYTAGVSYPIMENTTEMLPHLEGVWMPTVREYLTEIGGSLQIAGIKIQPTQRQHDRFIMDLVLESRLFKPSEIQRLNYCRLYLQILTVSDMCNATGTKLAPGIVSGLKSTMQSVSLLHEPLQERPCEAVWSIWRRFLKLISPDKNTLRHPLGPWPSALSSRRRWPNYFSPSKNQLFRLEYKYQVKHYAKHDKVRHLVYDFVPTARGAILPDDAVPVDVEDVSDGWKISKFSQETNIALDDNAFPTFREWCETLPDHENLLLSHHEIMCGDIHDMCRKISSFDNVLLVSDGGALADYGSYGWVLGLRDGTRLAEGLGSAFGSEPRSYRAEGYGAKAGICFILRAFEYCLLSLAPGGLSFYCDNQGLIRKLHYLQSHSGAIAASCMHSEWDIVSAIHRRFQQFHVNPIAAHVKGHQDDHAETGSLDLQSQMNIEADELATKALHEYGSLKPLVPFDPDTGAMLSIRGKTVTRNLDAVIRLRQHELPIQQYYCERFHWPSTTIDIIDWENYAMVYTKIPRTRTFFFKFGWKKLPVGCRKHLRSPSNDHRCPSCHSDHECDNHVFQCPHKLRQQWRHDFKTNLVDMLTSFLDPQLLAIIRIGLTSYFDDTAPDFSERFPAGPSSNPYLDLITQQNTIGWDHFIRGKISGEWSELQHIYASKYNLLKASEGWIIRLIRLMATSSFRLWEIRNGCRHGYDEVTKAKAKLDQAHREVKALYSFRGQVLPQDLRLFPSSLKDHLQLSVTQLRSWLTHNRKLILYSVKQAKVQLKLRTQSLSQFFQKKPTPSRSILPRNVSITSPSPPTRLIPARISQMYSYKSTSRSKLPTIPETNGPTTEQIARRRYRQMHMDSVYPDHPG